MRREHLLASSAFAIGVAASAVSVQAQSRCGATYEIAPGDTLYQVTQQCRVSLSRIYELNDIGNPRDIAVGTVLRLETGDQASADYGDDDEGDTGVRAPEGGTTGWKRATRPTRSRNPSASRSWRSLRKTRTSTR